MALQGNLREDPRARKQQGGGAHVSNVLHDASQLALGVQLASSYPKQVAAMTPRTSLREFWKPRPDRLKDLRSAIFSYKQAICKPSVALLLRVGTASAEKPCSTTSSFSMLQATL